VKESNWRRNYVVIYKVTVQRREHHFVRKAWVSALSGIRRPRGRGVKRSAEQQGPDFSLFMSLRCKTVDKLFFSL